MKAPPPTIVVLAAGLSTRMRGEDKLLEEVDGQPLLRLSALRATKAGVAVRVVLGPGQAARRAVLDGLPLEIVEARGSDGMAASIRAGVAGLVGPVLLALADMPEITAQDLYLMVTLAGHDPRAVLRAASHDGQPGHPVLFAADLVPALARLEGDEGARGVLAQAAGRVHLVPLEGSRALVDLDTPEAWAAWRAARTPA